MDLKDKRVLVTGGHGFLGKYICAQLLYAGADVQTFRSADYDLTKLDDAKRILEKRRPDYIIHAAARVGGIGANMAHPADFFRDNLLMGINLFEAICETGLPIKKTVLIGTTCSYPLVPPSIPFREQDLFSGYPEPTNAPYGIAKRTLFVGANAYRKQYGLNIINLIPANLYGPGDNFNPESSHVIPALIRKFCDEQHLVRLWGTGSATRSFLYAEDAAKGIAAALENYEGEEPVNLAADMEVSIKSLADLIAKLTDYKGKIEWDSSKPDGQPNRRLDTRKAAQLFGWTAETSFEEGLRRTINFWREINT